MDLDALAEQISATSDDPVVQGLSRLLLEWKSDDTTVEQLRDSVERYFGNSWIQITNEHERAYALWSRFLDEAIEPIAGMTMNERLFWFSLYPRFDTCETQAERLRIYSKLLASP